MVVRTAAKPIRKTSRVKVFAADVPVPQNEDGLNFCVSRIGTRQRERVRIETEMNDALAAVKAKYEALAAPHKEELAALTEGVRIYCEANRAALTKDGKRKYKRLAAGEVSWRARPPKVTIRRVAKAIEALEQFGLFRFLRKSTTIDKAAILKEPKAVAHIQMIKIGSSGEDFIIKPFETELEEIVG